MNKEELLPTVKMLQKAVDDIFVGSFGTTPLRQRLEDILGEAVELSRYTDIKNLKEEAGDLLCSTIQLCNECGWDINDLCEATMMKIGRRKTQYQGLGRKTKVAILGGAFNPITNGHIEVAQFVLNTSKTFDEVWLMPCYTHMYNKKLESPEDRLEMCRIASSADARIKVFDYEIRKQLRGETFHLVKQLLGEDFARHEYDFSMIIGMDNANTFDKWVNYEDLERMMRFVVIPRTGENPDPSVQWYLRPPHIVLHPERPLRNISSTRIRDELDKFWRGKREGYTHSNYSLDFLKDNMNEAVISYITLNGLYKPG